MWFCRKASSRSWSCRQARRESQRSWAETCCRRAWKAALGRNRVQNTNNWLTRNKGYRHFFRCRISSGHQAQQYRLCFAFAEVKIKVFHFHLRRRQQLRFLNAAFRKDFWVLRNLKSLIEILYRFIKVGFHFLSDLKLILRTREYSTLFAELGSIKGHLIYVQESLPSTFVQASR